MIATSDHGPAPYAGRKRKATFNQLKELETDGHYSSGVYRGYKFAIYEGAFRVPYIVRWPGVVKPAGQCDRPVAGNGDSLGRLEARPLSGQRLPRQLGEHAQASRRVEEGDPSLWAQGQKAGGIARGPLRAVLRPRKGPGETTNLAAKHPDKVAELAALLKKQIADGRSTPGPRLKNDRKNIMLFPAVPQFAWAKPAPPRKKQ